MSYGKYLLIWVWLIALLAAGTFISILPISKTHAVLLILFISSIKAALVILFYMHMKFERLIPLWAVAIFPFFLLGLASLLIFSGIVFGEPPPASGDASVPAFHLTDETGRPFESGRLKGKVWVADFIFTSCAGSCPQITERMRSLQGRLPAAVQLVSISVDPARDTPTALAGYAKRAGAEPGRWHFLTGSAAAIESLVRGGFRLSYAEGEGPGEPITHSVRFALVDQQGRIRGSYDSTDQKAVDHLLKDAGQLVH
ncbi:MAG: SCO family protein [Candidatus Omnitrophica bacterium]|nr:SCO family protein [Candidatus Omnitrophota bacterium]